MIFGLEKRVSPLRLSLSHDVYTRSLTKKGDTHDTRVSVSVLCAPRLRRVCGVCAHTQHMPRTHFFCAFFPARPVYSPNPTLEDAIAVQINYESAERYACTRGSAAAAPGAREPITTNPWSEPGALAAGQPERNAHCPASPLARATTA